MWGLAIRNSAQYSQEHAHVLSSELSKQNEKKDIRKEHKGLEDFVELKNSQDTD